MIHLKADEGVVSLKITMRSEMYQQIKKILVYMEKVDKLVQN